MPKEIGTAREMVYVARVVLPLFLEPVSCSLFQSKQTLKHVVGQCVMCEFFALNSLSCGSTIKCKLLSSCLHLLLFHSCLSDLTKRPGLSAQQNISPK